MLCLCGFELYSRWVPLKMRKSLVVYHLTQISGNSCWDVHGKPFLGSSHWKILGTKF